MPLHLVVLLGQGERCATHLKLPQTIKERYFHCSCQEIKRSLSRE